jgi:hypothetical protein
VIEILPDGSVVLALDGHCVQTAARDAHRELVAALLGADEASRGSAAAVDLLAAFLAGTDFAALRAAHPELNGSVRGRVRIFPGAGGAVRWEPAGSS